MRISRIYQTIALQTNTEIELDDRNTQYLTKVLRLKLGSEFCIFNGEGGEYSATLMAFDKRRFGAKIHQFSQGIPESPCQITLGQAISRNDHMDYALQKAVELGVYAIQPLMTEHIAIKLDAKRLAQKIQHWQGIVISACEQSGRCVVPNVYPILELSHWLSHCSQTLRVVLHPAEHPSFVAEKNVNSIAVLIGPEGGFSEKEFNLALHHQFQAMRLGPRILRTETAAIAAVSILQKQFGDG